MLFICAELCKLRKMLSDIKSLWRDLCDVDDRWRSVVLNFQQSLETRPAGNRVTQTNMVRVAEFRRKLRWRSRHRRRRRDARSEHRYHHRLRSFDFWHVPYVATAADLSSSTSSVCQCADRIYGTLVNRLKSLTEPKMSRGLSARRVAWNMHVSSSRQNSRNSVFLFSREKFMVFPKALL